MEQRMVTGDELGISREKQPNPDTILGVPHGLELPEKFPTPKTRTSLHLITTPDLLPDDNSVFQPHPKADWMSVSLLYHKGSPSPYQPHKHEFPEPAEFQHLQDIPLVPLLRELSSSPGRSHRSSHQAAQTSVLRTTKSSSLAMKGPHYVFTVSLLPLPLTLTLRAGSFLQPSPLTVSSASAGEPRKPLWTTACCCQKGTECQESPKGPEMSQMIQIYCYSPSLRELEISECPGFRASPSTAAPQSPRPAAPPSAAPPGPRSSQRCGILLSLPARR